MLPLPRGTGKKEHYRLLKQNETASAFAINTAKLEESLLHAKNSKTEPNPYQFSWVSANPQASTYSSPRDFSTFNLSCQSSSPSAQKPSKWGLNLETFCDEIENQGLSDDRFSRKELRGAKARKRGWCSFESAWLHARLCSPSLIYGWH